ncbi:hypothetical protein V5799_000211 [Amblyomma americanum]|uniref:Uncharacterized protein n=1 Tax=Amblyomma americanum TaxID=6943 RepID=A0AAQ4D3P6_AMBAM
MFYSGCCAVPIRLYRKTTAACTRGGTVEHRVDVCPNPRNNLCRACGDITQEDGHECQPRCLICEGAHLMSSADCTWKQKNGAGAGRNPGGGKSSNQRQSREDRKNSGPDPQPWKKRVATQSPGPATRIAKRESRQRPEGSGRSRDKKFGGAGSEKTTSSKVSWARVAASPPPMLAVEKLQEKIAN